MGVAEISAPRSLQLRPYQEETVAAAIKPNPDSWRRLLVLATGAGKTVIAAEILNRVLQLGQRALFLAHRDELLTQAKAEIEGFVPDLNVELEQAERRAQRDEVPDQDRRHVVVGSVQTMRGARLKTWHESAFDIVIIDEAHHSAAKSYLNIVEHFGCMDDDRKTPLIGVTATPMRSDKIGLDVTFQEISACFNIRDLVEKGFLCDIAAIAVHTDTDLREVRTTAGDYNVRDLEDAVNVELRNGFILTSRKEYADDRPTIVFCAGVDHAKNIAKLFRGVGVSAEAIWGDMGRDERAAALARYQNRETMVLTNFGVLTEGFNAPHTSCIILARPTKSELLFTQMVGRGTRIHDGKADCLIIDIRDVTNGKNLFSPASLVGLPAKFDAEGESLFDVEKEYEELKKLAPDLSERSFTPEQIRHHLEIAKERMRIREVMLLRRAQQREEDKARAKVRKEEQEQIDEATAQHRAEQLGIRPPAAGETYKSPFMWYQLNRNCYQISPDKGKTKYQIISHDGASWHVSVRFEGGQTIADIFNRTDLHTAVYTADQQIVRKHSETALIEREAPWTMEPPSEKQIERLSDFGLPVPTTRGEASRVLSAVFARQKAAHEGQYSQAA